MAEMTQGFGGGKIKSMRIGLPGEVDGLIIRRPDGSQLFLPVTLLQFHLDVKQNLIPLQSMQGSVEYLQGDARLEVHLDALVTGDALLFDPDAVAHPPKPVKVAVQESMTEKRLVVLDE